MIYFRRMKDAEKGLRELDAKIEREKGAPEVIHISYVLLVNYELVCDT